MNSLYFLRLFGAASCFAIVSCAGVDESDDDEDVEEVMAPAGVYSLDGAPAVQNRYMTEQRTVPQSQVSSSTATRSRTRTTTVERTPEEPQTRASRTATTTVETPPADNPPPTTTTTSTTTTPETADAPAQPSYGSPVAGRRGFVYPPNVEAKPENMVDVRDFTPGQKVRDPRTGKIFLVP